MQLFGESGLRRRNALNYPLSVQQRDSTPKQPLILANPWRRSLHATGAFLLFIAIAGGVMLLRNPAKANSENNHSAPGSSVTQTGDQNTANGLTTPDTKVDSSFNNTSATTSVSTQTTVDSSASPKTTVTVNGKKIPVSENSSYQSVTSSGNGTTTLNVSNTSSGNGTSSGSSFTSTNVNVTSNDFMVQSDTSQSYSSGGAY